MRVVVTFFVVLFSVLPGFTKAQNDSLYIMRSDLLVGFNYLIPQGNYAQSTDDNGGFGLKLGYYYQIKKTLPIMVGIDLGYAFMNEKKVEFETTDDYGVEFRVRESFNSHRVATSLRFKYILPYIGNFSPFIEGSLGYQYFFTVSNWTDLDSDRVFDPLNEHSGSSFFYGLNLGTEYQILDYLALYAKVEQTWGGSTSYLSLDTSIPKDQVQSASEYFTEVETSTDILTFELGIIARF